MKTLMVSHLLQILWAEKGTPGHRVRGAHGRAPGAPKPASRGRPLQRDNFPPAPRPLRIPRSCLARNPRTGMGTRVASASVSQAGGPRGQRRDVEVVGGVGALLGGWGCPEATAWQKTKKGQDGGTFADFLGFLVGFQTYKDR